MLTRRLEDRRRDDDLQRLGLGGATEGVAGIEVAAAFVVMCDRLERSVAIRGAPVVPAIVAVTIESLSATFYRTPA
jgi:hypothetical protein